MARENSITLSYQLTTDEEESAPNSDVNMSGSQSPGNLEPSLEWSLGSTLSPPSKQTQYSTPLTPPSKIKYSHQDIREIESKVSGMIYEHLFGDIQSLEHHKLQSFPK